MVLLASNTKKWGTVIMKKRVLLIALIAMMVFALTACATELGKWRISEVTAGDISMTQEDIDDMGLDPGFIKINRSGSCIVNLLGDEYEGTWTQNEDGSYSFNYGEEMTGTATIDGDVMTMTDAQGSVYILSK